MLARDLYRSQPDRIREMLAHRRTIAPLDRLLEVDAAWRELLVEVEVDTSEQLDRVLDLGVDWILLDNFTPEAVTAAVRRRAEIAASRDTLLEASGNIDLQNVRAYAEAGVDAVSVGRLTHSAPALDLALDLDLEGV